MLNKTESSTFSPVAFSCPTDLAGKESERVKVLARSETNRLKKWGTMRKEESRQKFALENVWKSNNDISRRNLATVYGLTRGHIICAYLMHRTMIEERKKTTDEFQTGDKKDRGKQRVRFTAYTNPNSD